MNMKKTLKKEKKKTALVLCGGGALGAYELGAWKALRELKIDFDIVTGTSIGALLGAFIVADKYDDACQLWANITPENVCKGGMNLNRFRVKSYIRYQKDARKKLFTLVRQVMRFS